MMAPVFRLRQCGIAPGFPLAGAQRFEITFIRFDVGIHATVLCGQERMRPTGRSDQSNFPWACCKCARRCCADLKTSPWLRSRRIFFPLEQALSFRWRRWYTLTAREIAPVGIDREWHQRIRKSVAFPIKVKYGI